MSAPRLAVAIVRATVAVMLVIHGVARLWHGTVDDFGGFLSGVAHIPFGHPLAWTITVVEIVGGLLLALGILVVPLCLWFSAVLVAGMWLVHWRNGWFVVGAGRNGVELSVLLVACLLAVALADWADEREGAVSR